MKFWPSGSPHVVYCVWVNPLKREVSFNFLSTLKYIQPERLDRIPISFSFSCQTRYCDWYLH